MYTQDDALLTMQLSDRILEIADTRNTLTPRDFQNAIDAVIMAAFQEGENAGLSQSFSMSGL